MVCCLCPFMEWKQRGYPRRCWRSDGITGRQTGSWNQTGGDGDDVEGEIKQQVLGWRLIEKSRGETELH